MDLLLHQVGLTLEGVLCLRTACACVCVRVCVRVRVRARVRVRVRARARARVRVRACACVCVTEREREKSRLDNREKESVGERKRRQREGEREREREREDGALALYAKVQYKSFNNSISNSTIDYGMYNYWSLPLNGTQESNGPYNHAAAALCWYPENPSSLQLDIVQPTINGLVIICNQFPPEFDIVIVAKISLIDRFGPVFFIKIIQI